MNRNQQKLHLEELQLFVQEMKNTSSLIAKKEIIKSYKGNEFIENALKEHKIFNVDDYKIFEVLRNIKRRTEIIDTTESSMSWLIPPFWLIQNKLWEVFLVTISVYLITLSVAWWMFAITWVLLAIYFNKGQTTILRSFSIYRDRHFWLVLAGINEEEIQKVCRKLDPKCTFDYPLVPPLQPDIKKRNRKALA